LQSFQCKKILDWSTMMGEIDGLSVIPINLLCSSVHSIMPLRWEGAAVFYENSPLWHLLFIYMYHQQRGLGRPLGFEEYRLYTDYTRNSFYHAWRQSY